MRTFLSAPLAPLFLIGLFSLITGCESPPSHDVKAEVADSLEEEALFVSSPERLRSRGLEGLREGDVSVCESAARHYESCTGTYLTPPICDAVNARFAEQVLATACETLVNQPALGKADSWWCYWFGIGCAPPTPIYDGDSCGSDSHCDGDAWCNDGSCN